MSADRPAWLTIGAEAAARALYEAWHPLRTENGFPHGAKTWDELPQLIRSRYLAAGETACQAFAAHDGIVRQPQR